jgi:SAM-dependent methyltransferase
MRDKLRKLAGTVINRLLGIVNLKLVCRPHIEVFLPFNEVINGAKKSGLSVGDYVESKYSVPGISQKTIERMVDLGIFRDRIQSVCEIGPGSGRYLEKTIRVCNATYYEFYETARDWADWLVKEYKVVSNPCDGFSLAKTMSNSIDLVQAHKVFSFLPFFTVISYFGEMARVVRPGGKVVFDILTEDCLDENMLEKWFAATILRWSETPALMAKKYAIEFFSRRGLSFVGSFSTALGPGETEYLVFSKQ